MALKVFKPRFTKPEKGNPYFNTISNGGYSTAIKGSPTDKDCDVLSNCFTGDTRIITRNGIVSLESIVGTVVDVLCFDGVYRPARCSYFGKQPIMNIRFGTGISYNTTWNHRWLVYKVSSWEKHKYISSSFVETKDLHKGCYIPFAKCVIGENIPIEAIQHGFIYGDGTVYNKRFTEAVVCGEKRTYMKPYFKDSTHHTIDKRGIDYYYPYPGHYKHAPKINESSLEYLKGFIIGLLAADGCVDKYGCVSISTTNLHNAQNIYEICSVLGFVCKLSKDIRDTNFKLNSVLYRILIKKHSITSDMLINPIHKKRLQELDSKISCSHVKNMTDLNCFSDVYCMEEPVTHTFTLEGGIVTGNCVGFAFGRFNEIGNNTKMTYLEPRNAERFYDIAIAQGMTVSDKPSIGACMVWQKGPTRDPKGADGAGHVAIVEQVISDTEVITSESGWNSQTPFWTQTRKLGSNKNWGNGDAYKFLGFIKHPDIDSSTRIDDSGTNPTEPYLITLTAGTPIYSITGTVVVQVGTITQTTKYTIVDETVVNNQKYGKLKSGAGWVLLETIVKPVHPTVMRLGDSGVDVLKLQKRLIELGYLYKDCANSKFDRLTLCGVTGYQLEAGLQVDGVCGPATQKSLGLV